MEYYSQLVQKTKLPKMIAVKQIFSRPRVSDYEHEMITQLEDLKISHKLKTGQTIAITGGSRGITNISKILKIIVDYCKSEGCKPFIFPAMGSHGGATAEGQLDILEGYSINEKTMGCPIKSSMNVIQIGKTEKGIEVFIDEHAAKAEGIIVVGRIKPHTAFTGKYESGLMKMMAIGMGKQYGASICHGGGYDIMSDMVHDIGKCILEKSEVLFGVGIIENAYDETAFIQIVPPEKIESEEPKLLEKAKSLMGSILFPEIDLLIVDKIGKNFSGDGADPNITGAFLTQYKKGGIKATRRIVLDLSDETQGNATGVGTFDVTTNRLFKKMIFSKTYPNVLTSLEPIAAKIPMVMECDKDAIAAGLITASCKKPEKARVIRIVNTRDIEHIWISEALLDEAMENPNIEIIGSAEPIPFDTSGNLW